MSNEKSYRSMLGLKDPPAGTVLRIEYQSGIMFYLLWDDCPDGDNIVAGWFPSKAKALQFAIKNGWELNLRYDSHGGNL